MMYLVWDRDGTPEGFGIEHYITVGNRCGGTFRQHIYLKKKCLKR